MCAELQVPLVVKTPGGSLSFEGSRRGLADLYGYVGIERVFLHRHHSVHQRADSIFPHRVLGVLDFAESERNWNSISCVIVFHSFKRAQNCYEIDLTKGPNLL